MADAHPTVSVIIPNYNYEKTIAAVVESVLAQTHPVHEVLVVDDGSTDRSPEIVRGYPVKLIPQQNGGVSVARNRGVAESTGDILFFLDSDIALAPDAIANAVALLREQPDLGCVHGVVDKRALFDDGQVERYRVLHEHYWRRRATGRVKTVFFAMCAMPRAVFEEIGPLNETLRESEDVEYSERLAEKYPILLTASVTGRHDDEERLGSMLSEQYRRSQLLVAFAGAHRFRPGAIKANRMPGLLAAAATWGSLPLVLVTPKAAVLPALGLAWFAVADPGLARFVVKDQGATYYPRFVGYHFLLHTALLAGVARGALRAVTDRDFRRPRFAAS
ncbi:glycosyltransferase family 2 protein [Kitasatospora sp. NPDC086801]|uniref:glycosyltransferase family 2 protein n=1 Tax=Kitasatospora sp. NPDC086801 TaxID=3364066 RepID=UPI003828C47F